MNSYAPRLLDGKLVITVLIVVNVIGLYGPVTTFFFYFVTVIKALDWKGFVSMLPKIRVAFADKIFPYRIPLFM